MNQHFVAGFEKRAYNLLQKGVVKGLGMIRRGGQSLAGVGKPGGVANRIGTTIVKHPVATATAAGTGAAGLSAGAMLGGGSNGN